MHRRIGRSSRFTFSSAFTPGVAPDITSRIFADKFGAAWGKAVVVDNVSGAGGNIATERTAKAAADGYTLLMGGNASLVFSPSMYDKLAYDPIKDFVPITQVFVAANVLVVHNDVPAKTLPELIALARAQPGKLTYAHAGAGTSQHLGAELLKYIEHLDIAPVAYRGTTALLPDLLAGRVTMSFANISNVAPLVKEGKLRAFAVSSVKRSAVAPDIPTMIEQGYPDFEALPWFGLMAPAGASPAVVDKVYRETMRVMRRCRYGAQRPCHGSRPRPGWRHARRVLCHDRARNPAMGEGDQGCGDQAQRVAGVGRAKQHRG